MDALNYIKRTHKEYFGYIDNNIYDEEGNNYQFYKLLYVYYHKSLDINKYIYKNFNKKHTLLNINKLLNEYKKNNFLPDNITILIPRNFVRLNKLIFKPKYNDIVDCIIIDHISYIKEINVKCDLKILNDIYVDYIDCKCFYCNNCNCNIDYINCEIFKCNNCNINTFCSKKRYDINLNYIDKNININKLIINNCKYITNINFHCNIINLNNNNDNIDVIRNINNFNKLIINNEYLDKNWTFDNHKKNKNVYEQILSDYGKNKKQYKLCYDKNNKKYWYYDNNYKKQIFNKEKNYKEIDYYYYGFTKFYFNDNEIFIL